MVKTAHQSEIYEFAKRDRFSMAVRKSDDVARIEIVVERNSSPSMSKAYSTPPSWSCQAIGGTSGRESATKRHKRHKNFCEFCAFLWLIPVSPHRRPPWNSE